MIVELNGRPTELPPDATVDVALGVAGVPDARRGLAVAVDAEVVPRSQWERRRLRDGERVEIVTAVQGG